MKLKAFAAAMLAATLLLALSACGKTQSPAASTGSDSDTQQAEQQTIPDASGTEDTPADTDESSEDEPWKAALADELFEKYGVLPEYYEDLGDGIYQVYVEVGGEVVPFGTVDSATGEYHEERLVSGAVFTFTVRFYGKRSLHRQCKTSHLCI